MKALKWLAAIAAGAVVLYCGWIAIALYRLPPVSKIADRKMSLTIQVKSPG